MTNVTTPTAQPSPHLTKFIRFPLTRIAIALAFVMLPATGASFLLQQIVASKTIRNLLILLVVGIVIGAYFAYVKWLEKRAVIEFSGNGAIRETSLGLAIGALLFSSTIGILALLGAYQVTGFNGWQAMWATLPIFIFAGVMEEILIRGVIFRILEDWLGSWIALAISALIFGALHLPNDGATFITTLALSLEAGVMLAAAYMVTRRLWLPIGIHIAWNFTQGGIFSVAVSGNEMKGLLNGKLVGEEWLTGGKFGAEASVVAVIVCVIAGVIFLRWAQLKGRFVPVFWRRSVPPVFHKTV